MYYYNDIHNDLDEGVEYDDTGKVAYGDFYGIDISGADVIYDDIEIEEVENEIEYREPVPMEQAKEISDLSVQELEVLNAAMEYDGYSTYEEYLEVYPDVLNAIRFGYYTYLPNIFSLEDVGKFIRKFYIKFPYDLTNSKEIGSWFTNIKSGKFTHYGWFSWEV